ncbi:MAG: hypothetical protein ACLUNV_08430 [Sutterella wadsworthensis]
MRTAAHEPPEGGAEEGGRDEGAVAQERGVARGLEEREHRAAG